MVVKKDKKTNLWYARVSYKDLSTGKYTKKSKFNFKRKKDAETWEAKVKGQVAVGLDIGQNPIFSEFFKQWVKTYKSVPNVAARTHENYLTTQGIVEHYFKDIRIKQINRLSYQEFLNHLSHVNAKSTNQKINKHIRAAVREAIRSHIAISNFTEDVTVSGKQGQPEEEKFLSEKEIKQLMTAIKIGIDDSMVTRWMAIMQFAGGLRYSEVAGLTYSDLKDNTLRINKAWDFSKKELRPTKTDGSSRTIRIEPSVAKLFRSYILRKKERDFKESIKNELLFVSPYTNYPPTHAAMNKSLANACIRAGVDKRTSHALRHTHVSLLLYRGMDIVSISKRIGHASPKTTMEEYSHIINELQHKSDQISDQMVASIL